MKADNSIDQLLLQFLRDEAPVFFAVVDHSGALLQHNRFVAELAGPKAHPKHLQDLIVDFTGSLDLPALAVDPGQTHLFHVNTPTGLPATLYFHFFKQGEHIVVLGKPDTIQQQRLRASLVSLNNDLHNLTRDLQTRTAELARLNEMKNQFVGMAAHDLRKPIGAILSYTQILLAGAAGQLPSQQRQFLQNILSASESMQGIVEDFLDLAVMESGRLKLGWAPADLAALIRSSIEQNRPLAQQRRVQMLFAPAEPLPPLNLDSALIQQALNNLLANALEHSPENAPVEIRATLGDTEVNVAVQDRGPGIRPEEMDQLFQPFGKARVQKNSGEKSTGLGLLITKKIIEAHHGHLWVHSQPQCGATFGFALPRPTEPRGLD